MDNLNSKKWITVIVGMFMLFISLVLGKLSGDNFSTQLLILIGAYVGINLLQKERVG